MHSQMFHFYEIMELIKVGVDYRTLTQKKDFIFYSSQLAKVGNPGFFKQSFGQKELVHQHNYRLAYSGGVQSFVCIIIEGDSQFELFVI